ncbi:GNAT family N-acetyltransferase [Psychromonas ossibalaenae]|uniref:GNAT family N-acetyltransferase n=1 Tax=Psychromonas ossibalaenae TaxID=444922 RepID=UPI00036AD85D|nr:GNAT family N-acetyltransferase [Psychromonas ossibalaenae]
MNRIIFRKLGQNDRSKVLEMLQDSEVMQFIGPRRALNKTEALEWFQNEYEKPSRFPVALKATNEFIGFCGIKHIDGVLDFGYFFRKSFWGQGLATETCKLAIEDLEKEIDFNKVLVFIAKANDASLVLARKLGGHPLQEVIKENEPGYYYRVKTGA